MFGELTNAYVSLRKSLTVFPLPMMALVVYMGLRSTTIGPEGINLFNGVFHYAYFGWYDLVLGYSIVLTGALGGLKFQSKDFFFLLTILTIIILSWVNVREFNLDSIQAGLIYYLRFALVFILGKSLVYKLGIKNTEITLSLLFAVLALSSLFVLNLKFGSNNRLFAAGMTAPSFGQVGVIIALIAYHRKNYWLLFIALLFTLLTFSRFCLLLFFIFVFIHQRKIISWKIIKNIIIAIVLSSLIIFLLIKFGGEGYQVVFASRSSSAELTTLNGRSTIWGNAWELLFSGKITFFGVGFNMTPSLISRINLAFFDESEGVTKWVPHFHSILIEYGFGLGVPSVIIFVIFLQRIIQTFVLRIYPAFFIFAFFLFSQSVDFTFWVPKELIIWSLMLGVAEGQYQYNQIE